MALMSGNVSWDHPSSRVVTAIKSLDGRLLEPWELDTSREYVRDKLTDPAPVTRHFTFEITDGYTNIGGVVRHQTLINGQFPGPVVHVIEGDQVFVDFINYSSQPASLHFHGFAMNGTNYMDGYTGLTQCAVATGQQFTYNFTASNPGTFYYHNHVGVESIRGLYGPVVVQERSLVYDYDEELVILLSDIYDKEPMHLLEAYLEPLLGGSEPVPSLALIQGKVSPVVAISGRTKYRVRLINASSYLSYSVRIDNHNMEVIELDGTLVEPRRVANIPIATAQRYSFLLNLDDTSELPVMPGYWIRANVDRNGLDGSQELLDPAAVLSYEFNTELMKHGHVNKPMSTTNAKELETLDTFDLHFAPLFSGQVPPPVDKIIVLEATMARDKYGIVMPAFNNSPIDLPERPIILHYLERPKGAAQSDAPTLLEFSMPTTVELTIYNKDDAPHPFHLHGHKFWVMERQGYELLSTPVKRDTVWVNTGQWVRIRFITDNPGVWAFHCHNVWHAIGGMEYSFVSLPERLEQQQPPGPWFELCG